MRGLGLLLLAAAAGALGACASSGPARIDLEGVQRVIVFPFENLTGQANDAGKRLTATFSAGFYRSARVEVVEQGEIERFITEERVRGNDGLNAEILRMMARQFGAQIVVIGVVNDYTYVQVSETTPVVGVTVRLVDPRTGRLLWSCSRTREGNDSEGLFGIGKISSLSRLAEALVEDLLRELASDARDIAQQMERPVIDRPIRPPPDGQARGPDQAAPPDEDRLEVDRAVKRHWQLIKERNGK